MKKFILLFASVASLFSGCSEYIVGYDASTIEHLCRINYTSLTKIDVDLFCCDAELIGHTWKDGVGTLYFNEDITVVRDDAFAYCSSLTSITIPNSVTTIGGGAFHGCSSLTSITIPDSVTEIGYRTFAGCSSLTSITIPDSVASIGEYAFYGCNKLAKIVCLATEPPQIVCDWSYGDLGISEKTAPAAEECAEEVPAVEYATEVAIEEAAPAVEYSIPDGVTAKIYVPKKSVKAYKQDEYWGRYKKQIKPIK